MDSTTLVLESQPDWLTAATHREANTRELRRLALEWQAGEVRAGNALRHFRLMGYVGFQAGRVRVGERENACLLQLSGDLAAQHLTEVRALQDSLTRFDIASTVRLPTYDAGVAERSYAQALAARAGSPRLARPKLVCDGDGGSTLYIGDRESPWMLRLYNKQAESLANRDPVATERYVNCWRYELECKGEPAPMLAKTVDESEDRPAWIQSYIHGYCLQHGFTPIFPEAGQRAILPGFTRRSDRQKTLAWFRRTVGPSVRRLLAEPGAADVYEALGLDSPPTPAKTETES